MSFQPQLTSILTTIKDAVINFFRSTIFERAYFFLTVFALGICVLLIWLMILMAIKADASWKIRDWLRAFLKPEKKSKKDKK